MRDFQSLSETELQSMIEGAKRALESKQSLKRKEVIAKIKELAASINVGVEIIEQEKERSTSRKGIKVADKYVHPTDSSKKWTGRGVAPKWMQELLDQGRNKSEFEIR